MRTYDLIFDGINDVRMTIVHKFFLLLSDEGHPIDISVRKNGGFSQMKGLQAGFGSKITSDQSGQEFIFSCEFAQTVKIFVGDDEAIYNRLSGTVTLNGGIITGITDLVITKQVGRDINVARYFDLTSKAAGSVTELVSIAENVNGFDLADAKFRAIWPGAGVYTDIQLVYKNALPVGLQTSGVIATNLTTETSGGGANMTVSNLKIPSGHGVYFITRNNLNTAAGICAGSITGNLL